MTDPSGREPEKTAKYGVEFERCAGECADCNEVRRLNDRASRLEVEAHNFRQDAEVARRQHMRRILREPHLKDGSA